MDKGIEGDSLWRPTPRRVWGVAMSEIILHFSEQIPGAPPAVCRPGLKQRDGGEDERDTRGERWAIMRDNISRPGLVL